MSSADWSTFNGKQGTITLTTTGTSGAATFVSNTLNIPNYADGGILSLSAIGASPNANAATITGTVLNLEPASASFGGVVTTGTQTFAGAKTFNNGISASNSIGNTIASTCSATGGIAFYGQSSGGPGAQFESSSSGEAALVAKHTSAGPLQYWMTTSGVVATMSNAGGLTLAGQLSLGSTITNGTYTYTLPSATGTLALTSALSSYLPLSGGTLTGALSGTSATFSGDIRSSAGIFYAANGTAALPSIRFWDNSTGFSNSSGALVVSTEAVARLTIASTGAATFSSTVTATGFFESSSVKGKDIMQTNPLTNLNLDVIQYTRKKDESKDVRYGYSAEQIHSLMPELTDKDVTSVKYLDVHTILIAQLQQEIKELKAKLN